MSVFRKEYTNIPEIARKLEVSNDNDIQVNINKIVRNMGKDYYQNFFKGENSVKSKNQFRKFAESEILKQVFIIAASDPEKYRSFWSRPETQILLKTKKGQEALKSQNIFKLLSENFVNKSNVDFIQFFQTTEGINILLSPEGQKFLRSPKGLEILKDIGDNKPKAFFISLKDELEKARGRNITQNQEYELKLKDLLNSQSMQEFFDSDAGQIIIRNVANVTKNGITSRQNTNGKYIGKLNTKLRPFILNDNFIWFLKNTEAGQKIIPTLEDDKVSIMQTMQEYSENEKLPIDVQMDNLNKLNDLLGHNLKPNGIGGKRRKN